MFKENIKRADTSRIAFPVLIALGLSHCFNDLLQSVVSAVYPILKDDLALTFSEIGLISWPRQCFSPSWASCSTSIRCRGACLSACVFPPPDWSCCRRPATS